MEQPATAVGLVSEPLKKIGLYSHDVRTCGDRVSTATAR